MDYKDLFIEVEDKYLFLMIFGGIFDIILGYPFLKKYEIIFNQDTKTLGFYKDMNNNDKSDKSDNSSSNTYYYLIIIFLTIILMILIYFGINLYIKKRKTKKKYGIELYNDKKEDNDNKNNLIDDGVLNN